MDDRSTLSIQPHEGGNCSRCGVYQDELYQVTVASGERTRTGVMCGNCAMKLKLHFDRQNAPQNQPPHPQEQQPPYRQDQPAPFPQDQQTPLPQDQPLPQPSGRSPRSPDKPDRKRRKAVIVLIAFLLVLGIGIGLLFYFSGKEKDKPVSGKTETAGSAAQTDAQLLKSFKQTYYENSDWKSTSVFDYNDRGLPIRMTAKSSYGDGETGYSFSYRYDEHDVPIRVKMKTDDETITLTLKNRYEGSKLKEAVITEALDEDGDTTDSLSLFDYIPQFCSISSIYRDADVSVDGTETLCRYRNGHLVLQRMDIGNSVRTRENDYDENGNEIETKVTYTDSADGHVTLRITTNYDFDAENRLTHVKESWESEDDGTEITEYRFDYQAQPDQNGTTVEIGTPVEIRNDAGSTVGTITYYRNKSGRIVESVTEFISTNHTFYNENGRVVRGEYIYPESSDSDRQTVERKFIAEYEYQ